MSDIHSPTFHLGSGIAGRISKGVSKKFSKGGATEKRPKNSKKRLKK